MADNYVIPFGVDMTKFFDGLNKAEAGANDLAGKVDQAASEMQKGFNDAANASEKLGQKLEADAKKAAALRDEAKNLGREIGAALSGKNVGADFEKRVEKFNSLLNQFSNNANKPIKFNIDSAKLAEFEKMLQNGVSELEVLTQATRAASEELEKMDPNTEEYQKLAQQIGITEGFLEEYNKAMKEGEQEQAQFAKKMLDTSLSFEQVYGELQPLTTRLGELEDRMYEMALAGDTSSDAFKALQAEAIRMRQTIQQVDTSVDTFAKNSANIDIVVEAVQGVVGVFTAAQGAIALFGDENEDAQEIIQKVTGAMAVLQGIQAAANLLNKDSAISTLLMSKANVTATATTAALTAAETADAAATTADTAAKTANAAATTGAATATRSFTAALLANPITAILVALAALTAAIIYFSDETEDAEEIMERFNRTLERSNLLLRLNEASINRRAQLMVAQAKLAGASESQITTIEGKALVERLEQQKKAYGEFVKVYNDTDARKKLSADENEKLENELIDRQETISDIENEIEVKRIDRQAQRNKEAQEAAKKAQEEAKKAAEQRRAMLEQELKFTNETAKSIIDALPEGYKKQREAATLAANQRIADLEREKSLSQKAEEEKAKLIASIRAGLNAELARIDQEAFTEQYTMQLKFAQMRASVMKVGQAQELELLRTDYNIRVLEIEQQFKNEIQLRDTLLDELKTAYLRKRQEVNTEFKRQSNDLGEQNALLDIEIAEKYMKDLPGIEEQKQIAILDVKIKYARENLKLLEALGGEENKQAIIQAKAGIAELEKELKGARNNLRNIDENPVDILDVMGISFVDKNGVDRTGAVRDALKSSMDSIGQITDFIVGQYQRQIDKRQEVIDGYNEGISELESQLEKEKELRDKGYANNVDKIQSEIVEKKKARDEEIRQQQELQQKQRTIAKAQLALDTAVQASNLITAATKIFSSLASIPYVGIPLAIATIALMTGAFAASKIKAFQLVNEQQFEDGGWISGKRHSQGGERYYSADGSSVKELEDGEHVTSRTQAAKYAGLLDAINNDDLSGMSQDALRHLLDGMGIHLAGEGPREAINNVRERDHFRQLVFVQDNADYTEDMKAINSGVSELVKLEKQKPENWEDDRFYYRKVGNKVTRIKK